MFFTEAIAHYFFPRQSNNQKAKILHSSTLLVLTLFLVIFQALLQVLPLSGIKILGYGANISPTEVINLTNNKRTETGLAPLEYNAVLASAAKTKGEDMINDDYWAHVSPNGTKPWSFFIDAGYNYRYAGENLARDFADPASAVEAWMASPTHKENILSSKYKDIGIAVVEGELAGVETTLIVQFFGTKYVDTTPAVPIAKAEESASSKPMPTPTPQRKEVLPKEEAEELVTAPPVSSATKTGRRLISPFDTTRTISLVTIVSLLAVMVIDAVITSNKKITRVGGRIFAHLAFLGMILVIVIIARAGEIL